MVMPGDRRLVNLAVAQIALGLVAGVLATINLPDPLGLARYLPPFGLGHILIVPLFALAMGQAVLLALWGVASQSSPWKRLAGMVTGVACLEALLALGINGEFLGTTTVTVAVITAALLVLRILGIRLARSSLHTSHKHSPCLGLRRKIGPITVFFRPFRNNLYKKFTHINLVK
jgi:hypothetical protein